MGQLKKGCRQEGGQFCSPEWGGKTGIALFCRPVACDPIRKCPQTPLLTTLHALPNNEQPATNNES